MEEFIKEKRDVRAHATPGEQLEKMEEKNHCVLSVKEQDKQQTV